MRLLIAALEIKARRQMPHLPASKGQTPLTLANLSAHAERQQRESRSKEQNMMDVFKADQDDYKRFLVTGLHSDRKQEHLGEPQDKDVKKGPSRT